MNGLLGWPADWMPPIGRLDTEPTLLLMLMPRAGADKRRNLFEHTTGEIVEGPPAP